MTTCHIDVETFSEINLQKVGVHRYAEDPSTEILCVCFAFGNDGPIHLWIPVDPSEHLKRKVLERFGRDTRLGDIYWGLECPACLAEQTQFSAHNAEFERKILSGPPGQRIQFPERSIEDWTCTAVKCAAMGLPRRLEAAADALETAHQKSRPGKTIMLQLSKPRKKQDAPRWLPETDTEKFLELYSYCVDDVETERDIDARLPDLTGNEQRLYWLDQRINDRGVMLDIDTVNNALFVRDQYKSALCRRSEELCGVKPTQTEKLLQWINGRYRIPNLQSQTIADALKTNDLPFTVRTLLRIRRSHEMKAPSKLDAMLRSVCSDNRMHGMFLFYGASTGRWSSQIVQLQNLFRGSLEHPELFIKTLKHRDLDWIRELFSEDTMQLISSIIRSVLVAGPGRDLLCVDYSAIEGRVTAWLSGQADKLSVYRTHGRVYEHTAAQMFGLPDDVESLLQLKKLHPDERFIGKTCELALGFQGGPKALIKGAAREGFVIDENDAYDHVQTWRANNEKIVSFWRDLENAFSSALSNPGGRFSAGDGRVIFQKDRDWMFLQLPSKRKLAFYRPEFQDGNISYLGVNTLTRQWQRVETFGGRLCENVVQATARDILADAMPRVEAAGYPLIGTVHDELIAEPVKGFGSVQEVIEIMCDLPEWGEGLPVRAEGFRSERYKKD